MADKVITRKVECVHCGNKVNNGVRVIKNNKINQLCFCSYQCYLDFWKDNENFEPLPEAK